MDKKEETSITVSSFILFKFPPCLRGFLYLTLLSEKLLYFKRMCSFWNDYE
jgi:hypothetical protein